MRTQPLSMCTPYTKFVMNPANVWSGHSLRLRSGQALPAWFGSSVGSTR